MPWAAAVAAVATIGGAVISSDASRRAAHTQADAAGSASAAQLEAAREQIGASATASAPWRAAGAESLYSLANLLGIDPKLLGTGTGGGSGVPGSELIPGLPQPGEKDPSTFGSLLKPFSMSDFQKDPGYDFRLQQGTQGIENSAAARGMQLSGSNLMALDRFNQGFASNEYQNAYNRYNENQTNQFNRLSSLAGTGQQVSQNLGNTAANAYSQYGQQVGNNIIGAGNANAAGQIGQGNAYTGALNNIGSTAMQMYTLNSIFGNKTPAEPTLMST